MFVLLLFVFDVIIPPRVVSSWVVLEFAFCVPIFADDTTRSAQMETTQTANTNIRLNIRLMLLLLLTYVSPFVLYRASASKARY